MITIAQVNAALDALLFNVQAGVQVIQSLLQTTTGSDFTATLQKVQAVSSFWDSFANSLGVGHGGPSIRWATSMRPGRRSPLAALARRQPSSAAASASRARSPLPASP